MRILTILGVVVLVAIVGFVFVDFGGPGPNVPLNGISTNELASRIMEKYDQDKSGDLSVRDESFLRIQNEDLKKTDSHGLLLTDADQAGNGDGKVDEMELINFLQKFDLNGDGELTTYTNIFESMRGKGDEWKEFQEKYGERFKFELVE